MFTGIIERIGEVHNIEKDQNNLHLTIKSDISQELSVDQSVSHNGVCLTVNACEGDQYRVTAIEETLNKSNLNRLSTGAMVNLERCMLADGRFDGHIVQGHVDQMATCIQKLDKAGSWVYHFKYDPSKDNVLVEKGSICVNGVSLTCFDVSDAYFAVAIIPYTYEHTNFHLLNEGDVVNLEFDIIGKYIQRLNNRHYNSI